MKIQTRKIKLLPTEYSSFRPEIHEFFLERVLPKSQKILDPWAGHASFLPYFELGGVSAHFNDILPIHYFLNQAKTFHVADSVLHSNLGIIAKHHLIELLAPLDNYKLTISAKWMDDDILNIFTQAWNEIDTSPEILKIFSRAIVLLCVRPYCSIGDSLNPTWLKPGGMCTGENVETIVSSHIAKFHDFYDTVYRDVHPEKVNHNTITFSLSDAEFIDLNDTFDTIFTSPPYCNRLDIYRLYNPELAFLGALGYNVSNPNILGTNIIKDFEGNGEFTFIQSVSPQTAHFLLNVRRLGKRRENNYYFRYHCRYYSKLFRSILKFIGTLQSGGSLYIVVQDNRHRGEPIPTAEFLIDFFTGMGLKAQVLFEALRHHLGKRNVSSDFPAIIKKHKESIVGVEI